MMMLTLRQQNEEHHLHIRKALVVIQRLNLLGSEQVRTSLRIKTTYIPFLKEEQLKYKFHAKCNKKIQYLNQRILLIEAERAKATKIPVEKRQLMKELIELLQDCIESPKDNEHENNIANTLRLGSTTLSDTVDNPNPPEQVCTIFLFHC
ncbi:hypothetical protein BCR33DRAFT_428546 [Rhizoclosmatium globosum]|uniref:Uncharacterized protein n=1 Tax=Rhizoclosmatium globosum TaxID=329046 RepID=A0A1Y2BUI4_9FUNG|nr:hypothetical protein BCR33DRAFT_428546 [Rhizoclosmatium globosum]|eukprot:ORY38334.1 hypothetical protein BCR33DRAFT_428546 [Rhizoclosmatium globosum]